MLLALLPLFHKQLLLPIYASWDHKPHAQPNCSDLARAILKLLVGLLALFPLVLF